jgi:hypothetical protein
MWIFKFLMIHRGPIILWSTILRWYGIGFSLGKPNFVLKFFVTMFTLSPPSIKKSSTMFFPACHNPTFGRVWGQHSFLKWGLGSLLGLPKIQSSIAGGQSTFPWSFLHVIGKLLKCRCRKWSRMSHLDICSTTYGKKKGRESNWQFDSRPLKVGNQPNPGVCRLNVTHRWKAL